MDASPPSCGLWRETPRLAPVCGEKVAADVLSEPACEAGVFTEKFAQSNELPVAIAHPAFLATAAHKPREGADVLLGPV